MSKAVWVITKNADFTEGRGPMCFHSVWANPDAAVDYVNSQRGIYGSPQKIEYGKFGKYAVCNGFDITEHTLFESGNDFDFVQKEQKKQAALAKLTKEERELLGI